jgi:hypothetical protein
MAAASLLYDIESIRITIYKMMRKKSKEKIASGENYDSQGSDDKYHNRLSLSRPRISIFRIVMVSTLITATFLAWIFWSSRSVVNVAPGDDFAAWVRDKSVMMTLTKCTQISNCSAPVLKVIPGEKVRIGFRSSYPISIVTEELKLYAAIDNEGWYLDTRELDKDALIGIVGGDANMWQFILSERG